MKDRSHAWYFRWRYYFVAWAYMENLLFGGLLYGWTSLVFILIDSGVYSDLCGENSRWNSSTGVNSTNASLAVPCPNSFRNLDLLNCSSALAERAWTASGGEGNGSTPVTVTSPALLAGGNGSLVGVPDSTVRCVAQDKMFSLVYSISTAIYCLACAPIGKLNHRFGTRVTRIFAMCSFTVAMLLIAFVDKDHPWLLFFGITLLGVGGTPLLITNNQLATLFDRSTSTVVALLMGAYDASSMGFQLVKLTYEGGIPRMYSCLFILSLHVLVLVSTFGWMPRMFLPKADRTVEVTVDEEAEEMEAMTAECKVAVENQQSLPANGTKEPAEEKVTLWSCVTSPFYLLHVCWLSVLRLRFNVVLGSLNPFLRERLQQDRQQVSHFVDVVQYAMLAGAVTSPVAGMFYDFMRRVFSGSSVRLRRVLMPAVVPLAVTTGLAVAMSLSLLLPQPQVLYLTFVLMVFFRSFIYGIGNSFMTLLFPVEYFGMMFGIMVIVAGFVTLLIYPIVAWAEAAGFFQVNAFLAAMNCVTLVHPAFLWWKCKRAKSEDKRRHEFLGKTKDAF